MSEPTSWGRTCASERSRIETHRDDQRESYEDAVENAATRWDENEDESDGGEP